MTATDSLGVPVNHSKQFEAKGNKLAQSPQKNKTVLHNDTKPLPMPKGHQHDDSDVFQHEFSRNDVRGLIHSITQELKIKGVKTPLVLLAFRPKADDHKLTEFLATVIPNGSLPAKQTIIDKCVKNTDEFTLVAALKYLWARLPMNAIVGWDAYDSFKKLEQRDNYPKKAFLEFMPQCLSSPSHASIVYDFLDLIVSFAANSKDNQLSGRKIAKMAGIWAFHGPPDTVNLTKSRLDPTENTFVDGLRDWLPSADAMFHLLLSFLRSMLPDDHSTKLQLPRTLQALLASNSYPPPDMTYSSTTLVSVPLVTIKTNVMSVSPMEMLNRVPKVLTFDNPDMFEAKEDFALLKSLCRSDDNILNKLSSESRRIIEAMCQKPKDSALKTTNNGDGVKGIAG
ncbi:Morphogenesis-related protein MSB1 [Cyberlindnera fabianii]|uniref:Morphogenesis-related protein MSB1 n=1 Tax=Cyberlindnera fabianii TaxID=36022 RepID=A0A1V2L8R6_CYBFA|nr:Morphogenesis-related protein MSB1 [Cyberlindnera fabianii]